jgi:hypothetical protein
MSAITTDTMFVDADGGDEIVPRNVSARQALTIAIERRTAGRARIVFRTGRGHRPTTSSRSKGC